MADVDEKRCEECGGVVVADTSPGTYRHEAQEGRDGYDVDREHVARPELE